MAKTQGHGVAYERRLLVRHTHLMSRCLKSSTHNAITGVLSSRTNSGHVMGSHSELGLQQTHLPLKLHVLACKQLLPPACLQDSCGSIFWVAQLYLCRVF
jgi:hypothetical protein